MASALDMALDNRLGDGSQSSNLMTLLFDEFQASLGTDKEAQPPTIQEFLAFSSKYLDDNPPVSQFFAGRGIGLTLLNGKQVVFNSQTDSQETGTGVPITRSRGAPGLPRPQEGHSIAITK